MKKVMIILACAVLLFSITACENNEKPIPTYDISSTNNVAGTSATSQPDKTPTDGSVPTQTPSTSPTEPSEESIQQSDPTVPSQNTEPSEPAKSEEDGVTVPTVPNVSTEAHQNTTTPPTAGTEKDDIPEETLPTTQADKDVKEPSFPISDIVSPTLTPHNPVTEDNYALWWQCEHCGKWIEVRDGHSCYEEHEVS